MSSREREIGATFDIYIITPAGDGNTFTVYQDQMMGEPLDADRAR
jgi:hypothetical protein